MFQRGKIPEKLYNLFKEYKGIPLDAKSLTLWLIYCETRQVRETQCDTESLLKQNQALYESVRRALSRLAQKKLIRKVQRGVYTFQDSGYEYIDRAEIRELANKVLKLIRKITGHSIPDTPRSRKILYEKLQDLVSSLIFQNS
jgi:hypothetical protein